MSAPLVQLANQSFLIGFDTTDDIRRKTYFRDGSGPGLTEQEKNLLISLGFDAMLEQALAPYMGEFFMDLQQCSSDTSIHLRKECELPYYVIWSALFHNQKETRRRLDDNMKMEKAIDDLDDAMTRALVHDLKPSDTDVIVQLFSLILLPERGKPKISVVDSLFKLMYIPERKPLSV
jgi:hypothetical protein